jgi:hypothetical protein
VRALTLVHSPFLVRHGRRTCCFRRRRLAVRLCGLRRLPLLPGALPLRSLVVRALWVVHARVRSCVMRGCRLANEILGLCGELPHFQESVVGKYLECGMWGYRHSCLLPPHPPRLRCPTPAHCPSSVCSAKREDRRRIHTVVVNNKPHVTELLVTR